MRKHSFPLAPFKINYENHLAAMAIAVVRIVIRDEIGIHRHIFGAAKASHFVADAIPLKPLILQRENRSRRRVEPGNQNAEY